MSQSAVLHFENGIDSGKAMWFTHYSILTTQYLILFYKESRSSAWLEHYTDNVGVSSSNLLGTTWKAESRKR